MPRPTPSELALRIAARSRRADAGKLEITRSVREEIDEVKRLAALRVLSEREFHIRLQRLNVDRRQADQEWRSLNI